ncbi:hypothetical protein ES708_25249 [subsurface metagenome]
MPNKEVIHKINLGINYKNITYAVASLSFNKKRELFYTFGNPSKIKAGISVKRNAAKNWEGLVDHISFHQNGTVHARHKEFRGRKQYSNKLNIRHNIFDIAQDHFIPIMIHSCFLKKGFMHFPLLEDKQRSIIWNLKDSSEKFSLIPVILGKKVNPRLMLAKHKLNDIIDKTRPTSP